jgi:hypothetical protein
VWVLRFYPSCDLLLLCADECPHFIESLIGESITRSHEGKKPLDELSGGIQSITNGTTAVSTLAGQVRTGSREQARAMEEIGRALVSIGDSTQKGGGQWGRKRSRWKSTHRGIAGSERTR